jgi:diguanylate cyclase (GGDEF)-like protein
VISHLLPQEDGLARPSDTESWDSAPMAPVASANPALLARSQAFLFAAAGVLGFVGVLLPHPDVFWVPGLVGMQLVCVLSAAALMIFAGRIPRWMLNLGPVAGTALNSLALLFSHQSTSAYAFFYLWIGLYAFYFLSRRQAALLVLFAALNYGLVIVALHAIDGSRGGAATGEVHHFVLISGTLIVAALFIVLLRERVEGLIAQLTDAARTDALTGLLNRRGFHKLMDVELERARRSHNPFSLLVGDLDFFKRINDRLGHQAGDATLQRVATVLEDAKRRIDSAARIGGEEFALILPETSQHEAYMLAERLRSRLYDAFGTGPMPLTMSFGVASYPAHGGAADSLLRAADEALYAAKSLGRDRSVLYSAEVAGILNATSDEGKQSQANLATVLGLAEALDLRDSGTAKHSQTVGRFAQLMARELGLPRETVERVRLAGIVHDIGKIAVPDSILRKPGPLTDDEYEQMKKHPEHGGRILGGSGLGDIRSWVLMHHERPDGRGYPRALGDDEIPLEAKVIAVADAYEAMISDRVYRKGIGAAAAREELLRCAGTQFDRRVVAAFLAALDREGDQAHSLAG